MRELLLKTLLHVEKNGVTEVSHIDLRTANQSINYIGERFGIRFNENPVDAPSRSLLSKKLQVLLLRMPHPLDLKKNDIESLTWNAESIRECLVGE